MPDTAGEAAGLCTLMQVWADGAETGVAVAIPECPSEAVFSDGRVPCDLSRGHAGPHSWQYPNINPRLVPHDA